MCRRETALLRAEILDLEDKYYALQAEHESLVSGAPNSRAVVSGPVGSGLLVAASPQFVEGAPIAAGQVFPGQVIQGQVIQDQVIPGQVLPGQIVSGQVFPGQTFPSQTFPGQIVDGPVINGSGTTQGDIIYDPYYPPSNGEIISQPGIQTLPIESSVIPGSVPSNSLPSSGSSSKSVDPSSSEGFNIDLEGDSSGGSPADSGSEKSVPANSNDKSVFDLELLPSTHSQTSRGRRIKAPTEIRVDANGSHGVSLDTVPGDDGLELRLECLDINGRFADPAGNLTVVVEEITGEEIGKWTFLPRELALFVARDELHNEKRIVLHLPWLDSVPEGSAVVINVSMKLGDQAISDTSIIQIEGSNGPHLSDYARGSDHGNGSSSGHGNDFGNSSDSGYGNRGDGDYGSGSGSSADSSGWTSSPTVRYPSRSTTFERPKWRPVR